MYSLCISRWVGKKSQIERRAESFADYNVLHLSRLFLYVAVALSVYIYIFLPSERFIKSNRFNYSLTNRDFQLQILLCVDSNVALIVSLISSFVYMFYTRRLILYNSIILDSTIAYYIKIEPIRSFGQIKDYVYIYIIVNFSITPYNWCRKRKPCRVQGTKAVQQQQQQKQYNERAIDHLPPKAVSAAFRKLRNSFQLTKR